MIAIALYPINIRRLWLLNFGLAVLYASLSIGFPFLKGSVLEYPNAVPAKFDGTIAPIAYVPNWLVVWNMNKALRYENVAASDFIELPTYDPQVLEVSDTSDKIALLARATYITPYMGSYRMNFKEYDGSHLWVDIRAPLWTPVRTIANGVVVKVVNTENADGKYVIIRHNSVGYSGKAASNYYSSYLHLESTAVEEGVVVSKGQVIGKVGMTGITTTPHLHFQIDTGDAPFHAYWPYTFQDLRELKLDFFEAVNLGLGKENAMKYTVHPMEFVQSLRSWNATASASSNEIRVASNVPEAPQTIITAVPVIMAPSTQAPAPTPASTPSQSIPETKVPDTLMSAPILPDSGISPQSSSSSQAAAASAKAFIDVSNRAVYAKAAAYLKTNAVPVLQTESVFRPNQAMTRREAILYLAGVFRIEPQIGWTTTFADIPSDDPALGYIATLQARGVVSSGWLFRPNDAVTKNELIALMLRITNDYQASFEKQGSPIKKFIADTRFARAGIRPDKGVTRADAARMIHAWWQLKRG